MSDPDKPGLRVALRQLGASLLSTVHTRFSLVGIELEEALQGWLSVLAVAFAMLLFGTLGLLVFSLLIVVAYWDTHRLLALGLLSGAYIGVAAYFAWRLKCALARRMPLLQASLDELEKDRDALLHSEEYAARKSAARDVM